MLVKIFQASGHDGIQKLETEINEWSINQPRITHADTSLAQIGVSESYTRKLVMG